MSDPSPTVHATQSRFTLLDAVRGIALLGVLLANIQWHSYFGYLTAAEQAALPVAWANDALSFLMMMLVDGKFYTIFSLLFGIGFSLIIVKPNGGKIIYRRLFILLMIGVIHSLVIWEGDILMLYALLGFTLPLFNKLKDRTILVVAICLLLSPILLDSLRMMSDKNHYPEKPFYDKFSQLLVDDYGLKTSSDSDIAAWQKKAGLIEKLQYNYAGAFFHWGYYLESNRIPKVLGIFLLGLLIGKRQWYKETHNRLSAIRVIRNWGLGVGLPASFMYAYYYKYVTDAYPVTEAFWYVFSVFPLAFGYAAVLALLYQRNAFQKGFRLFEDVGKIALTTYLLQSIIGSILFHGTGFGLATDFAFLPSIMIGIGLFATQILFAKWWVKRYQFGPAEWLWRQLTYGKRLAIKR